MSDTALWVAALRGRESSRPDALYLDPLATLLAGPHGEALTESIRGSRFVQWMMALRTVSIDRLVESALARGADTIVNLGAGMDTRPYRLALPASVRWLDVDFPALIERKRVALHGHVPGCRLELVPLDLTQRSARRELLQSVGAEAKSIVVLTEGVLPYLVPDEVDRLACDLCSVPNVDYWIQDYFNGTLNGAGMRIWDDQFRDAPIQFQISDWFEYFDSRGWALRENIRLADESDRVRRRPPFSLPILLAWLFTPSGTHYGVRDRLGYALFERA